MDEQPKPELAYESREPQRPPRAQCPKCGGAMRQGVLDSDPRGNALTSLGPITWIEGEAERGWFGLMRLPRGRRYEVVAFRCPGYGFVEFYSPAG